MTIENVSIAAIRIGERRRPVDPYIAWDLQQSIQQSGLLHNIGVIQEAPDRYRLIYGAHRLAAVTELEWAEIPARVFPEGTSDEECLLVELQENMTRNELTGAERKAFAAEVGRLILKLQENSNQEGNSNLETQWILEWIDKIGITQATAYNWWAAYCKDSGLKLTPKQANIEHRADFFRWLDEQKAKDDAEKARKADEADAIKRQKEEERQAAIRARALLQAKEALEGLIRAYDEETVWLESVTPAFAHLGEEMRNTSAQAVEIERLNAEITRLNAEIQTLLNSPDGELAKIYRSRDHWEKQVKGLKRKLQAAEEAIYQLRNQPSYAPFENSLTVDIWRRLVQLAHPDKHGDSEAAHEVTAWLNQHKPRTPVRPLNDSPAQN